MAEALLIKPTHIRVEPTTRELAIAYVCQLYDMTRAEFVSPRVSRHLVMGRKLFVWLMRTHRPNVSYVTLGRWMKRHHTSVIYLFEEADKLLQTDEEFAQECARFPHFVAHQRETVIA